MTTQDAVTALRAELAADPGSVLEDVAARHGCSVREASLCLPQGSVVSVPGACFVAVMEDIAAWGGVLLLLHTQDLILECSGCLPAGKIGHGFYNLGGGSALGGHVRYANCTEIHFVSRPFMRRDTRSILFFNAEGGTMFKIFVARVTDGTLRADQVVRFERLRDRCGAGGAAGKELPGEGRFRLR